MPFDKIFQFTLKWEGWDKITDDPDDPGGLTKFGLSKKSNPDLDIASITPADARDIYKARYWRPVATGANDLLDMVAFDTAVNCGVQRVKTWLLRCSTYSDMLDRRLEHYEDIIARNPKLAKYRKGWKNRVVALRKFLEGVK
jgi:lysozyme family protein